MRTFDVDIKVIFDEGAEEDYAEYCNFVGLDPKNRPTAKILIDYFEWRGVKKFVSMDERLSESERFKKWPARFFVAMSFAIKALRDGDVPPYLIPHLSSKRRDLLALRDHIFKEVCERYELPHENPPSEGLLFDLL